MNKATILSALLLLFPLTVMSKESLIVSIVGGPAAQKTFFPLYSDFEEETGIKIIRYHVDDMKVLDNDKNWFTHQGEPIDVLLGHASERLNTYYQQGKIVVLNEIWNQLALDEGFSHLKPAVTFNNNILGLPYEINGIHLYFKNKVIEQYGGIPNTISELAKLCQTLNKNDIVPFHLSTLEPWTVMIWFEYLVLRNYDLNFYYALVNGKVPYDDERVTDVLQQWKSLIDANCYSEKYGEMFWHHTLPLFYRNKVAMILIGNYILPNIMHKTTYDDLNVMSFPSGKLTVRNESMPINLFFVNKLSKKQSAYIKFLAFIARPEIQKRIADVLFSIPAHKNAVLPTERVSRKVNQSLQTAAGATPFMDRILPPEFEIQSRQHFVNFIRDGDIKKLQIALEKLRKSHY